MPLHLLTKKSWNVYAPDNIARVKRDHAEAQAREAEDERRTQEQDSARRLALLRGEDIGYDIQQVVPGHGAKIPKEQIRRDDRRKRRRLQGEDDTDRDLRLAREYLDSERRWLGAASEKRPKQTHHDMPIIGHNGHTNLFPVDTEPRRFDHRDSRRDAEQAQVQQREFQDQCTLRFSQAGGRNVPRAGPWYAVSKRQQREDMEFIEGKDVWGQPDPLAKARETTRQNSDDPFALMQRAQTQLKQAEKDKKCWQKEEQADQLRPRKRSSSHRRESFEHRAHQRKHDDDEDRVRTRAHNSYKQYRSASPRDSVRQQAIPKPRNPNHHGRLPEVPEDLNLNA